MKHYGLQQVLGAIPVLFCGWIGLYSRTYRDPFEFQAGSYEQDYTVFAYEPYVRTQRILFRSGVSDSERDQVVDLARRWSHAAKIGELRPLSPTSFEDSCNSGVRGGIHRSRSQLVQYLLGDADELMKKHHYTQATKEVLIALRLSESMKYGDFVSIADASAEERRAIAFLRKHANRLSDTNKRKVRDELNRLMSHRSQLLATTQASNARFFDFKERMKGQVGISEIRQTAMIGRRLRAEGKSPKTLAMIRKNYLSGDDLAALEHLWDLRVAWRADEDTRYRVEQLLERL